MATSRIGVFGGSFDPIHIGHLVAAACARDALKLDRVLFVVANQPWQKADRVDIMDAELRYQMVAAAVEGERAFEASRIEIDRGGLSYTADTVQELYAQDPEAEIFLVMGSDVAAKLETWNRWQEVAERAQIAMVNRWSETYPDLGSDWKTSLVSIPNIDLSSTELRGRLRDRLNVEFLIPAPALKLLQAASLYP